MREYFWNEFDENTRNNRYRTFIEKKGTEPLSHIYGMYYNKYIQKLSNTTLENYISKKNREVFLNYLSKLLRNGELKMKTFEIFEKPDPDGYEGKVFSFHKGREWKQEEIEEGINFIRTKWNSISRERERSVYEDWGVMFTLPENEWMY